MFNNPFSNTKRPKESYLHSSFREGLSRLEYFAKERGIFLLTGDVGTGKTLLAIEFIDKLSLNHFKPIYIQVMIAPKGPFGAILFEALRAFGEEGERYLTRAMVKVREAVLRLYEREGKASILVLDEAQNLDGMSLKNLKYLFGADSFNPLGIILIGQPTLKSALSLRVNEDINQRINYRYHLGGLDKSGVKEYIEFRLKEAGIEHPIFADDALEGIYYLSRGIPRLVNQIAHLCLVGMEAENKKICDLSVYEKVKKELESSGAIHL